MLDILRRTLRLPLDNFGITPLPQDNSRLMQRQQEHLLENYRNTTGQLGHNNLTTFGQLEDNFRTTLEQILDSPKTH